MTSQIDPESVAIGRAVRGAIVSAGMSLAEVAERVDIAPRTMSRRVNGALPFTFPELVKIANVCGVKVSELVASAERIVARAA